MVQHSRFLAGRLGVLLLVVFGLYAATEVASPVAASAQDDPACETNDDFACRTPISLGETVTGSNIGANAQAQDGEQFCGGFTLAGETVWWSFTAETTGLVQVNTFGSNFPTAVSVYELSPGTQGVPSADGFIECRDVSGIGLQSLVKFDAVEGAEYGIQVMGSDGQVGELQLTLGSYVPLEFDVTATCVSGVGRVTLTATNANDLELALGFFLDDVAQVAIAEPGETSSTSITGRMDGSYQYEILDLQDDEQVTGLVMVDCIETPPGPAVVAQIDCIDEAGVVRLNLVAGATGSDFDVVVGQVFRSVFIAANEEAVMSIFGRADGIYDYTVTADFGELERGTVEVDCVPEPAESAAVISVSCGSNSLSAGVIAAVVTASGAGAVEFVLQVTGLADITQLVAAGETTALRRTGRPNGAYDVVVLADGVILASETVEVRCGPDGPGFVVSSTCVGDRGLITIEMIGHPEIDLVFKMSVEGLETRSFAVRAGTTAVDRRSGRPNGLYHVEYEYRNFEEFGRTFGSQNLEVTCDQTQTCTRDGIERVVTMRVAECEALVAIAEQSPVGDLIGWDLSRDPCTWSRVTCTRNHVTSLDLIEFGLQVIPPEISTFVRLEFLYLEGNELRELSSELFDLPELAVLFLHNNDLTELDPRIGSMNLRSLRVPGNALRSLPAEIGLLTGLNFLEASQNMLSSVPDLTALTQLIEVSLCGQGQRIEIDPGTKQLLDSLGNPDYQLLSCSEPRGDVDVRTSCVAGRGSITATYFNFEEDPVVVSFKVSGLESVDLTVGPGEAETSARTGRLDGVYLVTVKANGHDVFSRPYEIVCPAVEVGDPIDVDGRAQYEQTCASCHGVDGAAVVGEFFEVALADSALRKEDIVQWIEDPGVVSVPHAFSSVLTADEIDAIADYVLANITGGG